MTIDLVIKGNIWTRGGFVRGGVGISGNRIAGIYSEGEVPDHLRTVDVSRCLVFPGLVDPHAHLRDMNLSYKEDYYTGTCAAVAGGFTTVLDMPNTVPATKSLQTLKEKEVEASKKVVCDVGFHLGFNTEYEEVDECLRRGVFSVKLYPEDLRLLSEEGVEGLLRVIDNIPLYVHAEDLNLIERNRAALGQKVDPSLHPAIRTPECELRAIRWALDAFRGLRVHFAHVTLAGSLSMLSTRDRSRVTFEATPHHLHLTAEMAEKLPRVAKVNPPIRSASDVIALRKSVNERAAEAIGSDHAPHALFEKIKNDYDDVASGFPSLETAFPLLYTLSSNDLLDLNAVVEAMTAGPAKIFNIASKGKLERGYDADLFIYDPAIEWEVRPELFKSKAKFSPFDGMRLKGQVISTYLRGAEVFSEGKVTVGPGYGRIIARG